MERLVLPNKRDEGKNMKSIFKWIFITAVMTGLAGTAGADVVDRIVAVVNNDVVILSELNAAFEPYMERINESYKGGDKTKVIADGKTTILNRLVDNKLIEQQSKKSGIVVKDEDVMNAIKGLLGQRHIEMDDFVKTLTREGSTLEAYKQEVKERMVRQRLIRREIQSKILVSDEEVGEYYKLHREDYEGKEAVRIKQILLLVPKGSDQKTRDAIRLNARDIRKRLLTAESFNLLAAQYSQGPAADSGGDVGFIERGQVLPEVEAAAFGMQIEDISDVIESPLGFHIIKVIDKKGAGLKPFPEVRQEIMAKIEDQKMSQRFDQWLAELRKKSHIEIKL